MPCGRWSNGLPRSDPSSRAFSCSARLPEVSR
jgi:hypothetical protein